MLIYLVLSVSIAGAASAFPQAGETAIQYLLTVPSLACILGALLVPPLSTKLSQRTLSIGAQAVSLIGAVVYLVCPASLALLYGASFIMGLAFGVLATTFPLLVNLHVQKEQRNRVIGIASGMVQFGRLASLLIAGFLGDIRWNFVYFTYFLVVISLCILVPCLPRDTPMPAPSRQNNAIRSFLKNRGVWGLAIYDFLFGIIFFMTSTHISLYIEGYRFGSASLTGVVTSLTCGVAGVVACLFAKIYKVTKQNTLLFIFLLLGVGYLAAGLFVSLSAILLCVLCGATAASIFTPYILARASEITTPEMVPTAVSVAVAFLSIGFFISPSVTNFFSGLLFDGSPASAYLFGGICSILIAACLIVLRRVRTDKRNNAI